MPVAEYPVSGETPSAALPRTGIRAYLGNTAWLMGGDILNSLFSLLVLVLVARYYGADQYGAYAYVFAIAQLFAVLGQMGLDGLLTRELIDNPNEHRRVLGTAGGLRFAGYLLGAILCLAYGLFLPQHDAVEKWLFLSAFLFILFTPGPMILENWFHSRVEARYSSIAKIVGSGAAGIMKLAIILLGWSIVAVGFVQAASVVVVLCVLLPLFLRRGGPALHRWSFDSAMARKMLAESWLVFLGSAMVLIYLKIDQVMLRWWWGAEEVGIYAVAARMSEVFYLIPAALVTTVFPRLIQIHREQPERFTEQFETLLAVLTLLAYTILAFVLLFGSMLVVAAFGAGYAAAGPVLMVHACSLPFIFMRYAFSRWILVERFILFSVISQGIGAVANVLLNIVLIPLYGMMGAAVATLVSYAAASYFALLCSSRTRPVFRIMTKALLMPWIALPAINAFRSPKGSCHERQS